jgi:hypothetical protein
MIRSTRAACAFASLWIALLSGCANDEMLEAGTAPPGEAQALPLLGGILDDALGLLPLDEILRIPAPPASVPAVCPPPDGTRPDPTLVNVDASVLSRFPLSRVYRQLVRQAGASNTASALFQQLWDSYDLTANAKFPGTPHCDDADAINRYPIECPRAGEASLKNVEPDAAFRPVALFNRFDLAPADGHHCGEYRIIYALDNDVAAGRVLLIYEAVLPNPNPGCGLESCRPIVNFWRSLATQPPNSSRLADKLESFYFDGLPGFAPVVHAEHFGARAQAADSESWGQIRMNVFVDDHLWQLREALLRRRGNTLVHEPVSVKNNPYFALFGGAYPDARTSAFQAAEGFAATVKALAAPSVNAISMSTPDRFNAGQSDPQGKHDDYVAQFASAPASFASGIQSVAPSGLTAADLVERANTQSCGGCHEISNNRALGGGLRWPPSRRFVHVDEAGNLSPALWCSFLPGRKQVLDGFAASPPTLCLNLLGKLQVVIDPGLSLDLLPSVTPSRLTVSGKVTGPN